MSKVGKILVLLRSRRVFIPLLVLGVFYVVFLRGGADVSKIETAEVRKGRIVSEVSASGKVTAESESDLRFAVSGKVVSVRVSEGDLVKKGQVIATLDRELYEIALRQANQDVVAADAELVKVYDDLDNDDSIESYDEKIRRTAVEAKKNKAVDNLKAAERNLRDTVLVSPINGTLVRLNIKPLEEVLITTDVGKIVDTTSGIEFLAEVDETEISNVETGQKSKVILDAFEEDEIESIVVSTGQQSMTTSTGATAYEVKLTFPFDTKYKVGMNGEARIIADEVENTLVLNFDALVEDEFVWVKRGGGYEKVKIEKGLESDLEFEVVKGLSEGDIVVRAGFDEIEKKSRLQKILSRP